MQLECEIAAAENAQNPRKRSNKLGWLAETSCFLELLLGLYKAEWDLWKQDEIYYERA